MSKQLLRDNLSKIQVGQGSNRDIAKIVQLNDDGVSNLAGAKLIAIDFIEPNPDQPRKDFNQLALEELAASIKQRGILPNYNSEDISQATESRLALRI